MAYLNQLQTTWSLEKWFSCVIFSTSLSQDCHADQYLIWSGKESNWNTCGSGSHAAKVTLILLGLWGSTILQPSPRWEKNSLSQFLYRWSWVLLVFILFGFACALSISLMSQCVAFVTKAKLAPVLKTAEMYGIFTVLISENSLCRDIAIVLHLYEQGCLFKVNIWWSNLEIRLHY